MIIKPFSHWICKNDNRLRNNGGSNEFVEIAHGIKTFYKTES